jgi:SPP1 family predicted phage head-tail adaptor
MQAGKLHHIIAIEREIEAVLPSGSVSKSWTNVATIRAEIVQRSAAERLTGYGEAEDGTIVFRIRYRPGLKTRDRVVYDGRAFDIKEITEIGRKRGLELRGVSLA